MNYILGYAIGLSTGVDMQELSELPMPPPYPVEYSPYTSIAGMNGLGEPVEVGPPTLTWNWSEMLLRNYEFFLGVCSGSSMPVFIKTRLENSVGNELSFGLFSAIMWRPKSGVKPGPKRENVVIKFTNLERFG